MVVMLAIGTTDVMFALDSIPAIFGLTQDPYIVFTANAFALMGLRQLYFLIGGLMRKLVHLSYGLSVILGFIGVKLVLHALHELGVHVPEIGISLSLSVIGGVLLITTVTSLLATRKQALTDSGATAAGPVPHRGSGADPIRDADADADGTGERKDRSRDSVDL
jgi:tellurite resistance protein TerC